MEHIESWLLNMVVQCCVKGYYSVDAYGTFKDTDVEAAVTSL